MKQITWTLSLIAVALIGLSFSGCGQTPMEGVDGPPAYYVEKGLTMPFDGCLFIWAEDTDRECGGDEWTAFPERLQYCDETIYFQEDDGKVAICAPPTCDLSPRQQYVLYMYAYGTGNIPSEG